MLSNKNRQARRKITVVRKILDYDDEMPAIISMEEDDSNDQTSETRRNTIDIVAPAGKLGLRIDYNVATTGGSSSARVIDVEEDSPVLGDVRVWDRIVAVDGEDASRMNALDISSE